MILKMMTSRVDVNEVDEEGRSPKVFSEHYLGDIDSVSVDPQYDAGSRLMYNYGYIADDAYNAPAWSCAVWRRGHGENAMVYVHNIEQVYLLSESGDTIDRLYDSM